jgi:hypothetical protein
MTGSTALAFGGHTGVMTFKNRQSSLLNSASRRFQSPSTGCAHGAPKVVASRTPLHAFAGTGSRQRKSPTGFRPTQLPGRAFERTVGDAHH